jgi:hypothetical protein
VSSTPTSCEPISTARSSGRSPLIAAVSRTTSRPTSSRTMAAASGCDAAQRMRPSTSEREAGFSIAPTTNVASRSPACSGGPSAMPASAPASSGGSCITSRNSSSLEP